MPSGQCCSLPRNKDHPEPQAFEGPKAKREREREKKIAPQPSHSLETIGYKTKKMVSVCEDTWTSS